MSTDDKKQSELSSITLKNRQKDDFNTNSSVSQIFLEVHTAPDPTSSAQLPPPPPPLPIATKATANSSVPLKKVNWNKIEPQRLSKDCFWKQNSNKELLSKDLLTGLAENFSSKPVKKIAFVAKSNITLRVIDTKNAQSLLILLRVQYKNTSHEQIKEYILNCDDTMIQDDFIEGLMKCLPQPHQIEQLCKLKNSNVELADAESFLASLCLIERLKPRLNCIKFKIRFNDMVKSLILDIEAGTSACEELISSQKFAKILQLILSIGNIMNSGTICGQAVGFDLLTLTKLNDVKSTDNKQTLLYFLVQTIANKFPELMHFGNELLNVDEAANLNVNKINDILEEIAASSEKLKIELQQNNQLSNDKFFEVMSPFSLQCDEKLENLKNQFNQMKKGYMKVADYFVFDTSHYPMEECFSNIRAFKDMFSKAYTDIEKKTERLSVSTLLTNQQNQQKEPTLIDTSAKMLKPTMVIKDVCWDVTVKLKRLTEEEIRIATRRFDDNVRKRAKNTSSRMRPYNTRSTKQ